jgi:DNA-binding PadR family transcriptional regulator
MNTLSYAILGLIDKDQLTGYDLTKIFNDCVADFWSAKQSQIYTELKKLVAEELIDFEVVIQGEVLEKKIYSLTPKGKETLLAWMSEEEPPLPQSKDIFKLRLYFSENLTPKQLQEKFENRSKAVFALLLRYQTKLNEYCPETVAPQSAGDYLLLKGAVTSLESQLRWLEESLDFLNKLRK